MTFTLSMGCVRMCTFGLVPFPFLPLPGNVFTVEPVGNMIDIIPFVNIFHGVCVSPIRLIFSLGIPQPCVPIPVMPKTPAAYTVLADGIPMALIESMDVCGFGGVMETIVPDQFEVFAMP
jgi:hypothetical protein